MGQVFGTNGSTLVVWTFLIAVLESMAAIGLLEGWLPSGLFLGITAANMGVGAAVAMVLAFVIFIADV